MRISSQDGAVLRAAGPEIEAVAKKVYQIGVEDGRREQSELDRPWIPPVVRDLRLAHDSADLAAYCIGLEDGRNGRCDQPREHLNA